MNNSPIGIFDSGVGGLTVVKEIIKLLPNENIVYFGDTARVPYGNKSPKLVQRFALEITRFLEQIGVKMIVIACNTASSLALEFLKKNTNLPIVGVIEPGVRAAITATANLDIRNYNDNASQNLKVIGIIGTKATIMSEAYQNRIKALDRNFIVLAKACPLFVPIVEENLIDTEIADKTIEYYLSDFKQHNPMPNAIILACTHYPMLKNKINYYFEGKVKLIDSAYETALEVKKLLYNNNLQNSCCHSGFQKYFVSDSPETFTSTAEKFLGWKISNITEVSIPNISMTNTIIYDN